MRWHWNSATRATAALLFVLLAATAGCARPSAASSADAGDQATPNATSSATASPDGAAGGVSITLTKDRFNPDESLVATIKNGLATAIWTTDHHSDCSLLTVESFSGGAWNAVNQCSQPRPVKVIELPAGVSAPQSIGFSQNMDMGAGWSAGMYRLSLAYALNQSQVGLSGTTMVYSGTFTIG